MNEIKGYISDVRITKGVARYKKLSRYQQIKQLVLHWFNR